MKLTEMSAEELASFKAEVQKEYDDFKAQGLSLNMARGKPSAEQLDLTEGLLTAVKSSEDCFAEDGTDCRNYGGLDGLPEAKALFAPMLGVTPDELIICGNSSLNIMYDTIAKFMLFGTGDGEKPWKDTKVKWLCPVPGYDRHFLITEKMGFELVNIPMDKNGPDMDMVEKLVAEDDTIKGIWCVPMYANPTGTTYSDEVVKRLAAMTTKAKDFKIFWDNAYCIHHLSDTPDTLLNILDECEKAGNPDRVYMLASTSKVTFPGAGVAMIASSEKNIKYLKSMMTVQTIGYDKINQLRHVKFFGTYENLMEHMKKHSNSTDTCCAHRLAENLQRAFKHHGVHSSGSASVGELPDSIFYTEHSSCIQKHGYNHCCILRWFDNNRYDDGLCRSALQHLFFKSSKDSVPYCNASA